MARTTTTASMSAREKNGSGRTGEQTASDLAFYSRAMKAPALLDAAERLAGRARSESWTHAEFLVACLQREVAARESHGGEARVRSARFPAIKTIEELDVTHLRGMTREQLAHLGTLDFIVGKENAIFLGPPGTGKTHLAIGLAVRACQAGHRVAFATAAEWVDRLATAHHTGRLQTRA
ncbi:Insertion sequence IS5376 putative ATP-binding protein [Streptomyces sp. RB17]|uniref:ATP-binding protein n=1 Tax=Streptomyces sp. RB17 TaxID=2585197 RepID=UPI00130BEE1F|nr:ATP-binding protein [Streptomyces sp. RB17]MQY40783.1 Insertion sequence IS5376 putative ATP-binding protein [Streptomyces sp. RB17]